MIASFRVSRALLPAAIAVLASRVVFASGGDYCEDALCRSFFSPEIIGSPHEVPFFLSGYHYYPFDASDLGGDAINKTNLDEWKRYFNNRIPETELKALLYELPLADVVDLRRSLAAGTLPGNKTVAALKTAFTKYGRKAQVLNALEYLALAKRVEPIATRDAQDAWGTAPKTPVSDEVAPAIIADAERQLRGADRFLAQRYRFQIVRLLYYTSQFSAAENYFERNQHAFAADNSPTYRTIAAVAGAYYKEKKFGRANYLFSRVFDQFPPLKTSSYSSFHPMEDADWRETLSLARSAHEREVLWQLLGIYADGLEAINQIYRINPKSPLLELLLVREVNKAEVDWTANRDELTYYDSRRRHKTDPEAVGPKRIAALKEIADAGNTNKPYLWQLSVGHLLALAGNLQDAGQYLDAAEAGGRQIALVEKQIRMSRLFTRVRATVHIDRPAEPYLAEEFEWLAQYSRPPGRDHDARADHLETWARAQLRDVYASGGDDIRALMLTDTPSGPLYQRVGEIERIAAFIRNAESPFDRWLVRNYNYSVNDLEDLRAINFLYAGDLSDALDAFNRAGAPRMLNADPFTIHIKDCHDCDAAAQHTTYSAVSFTERMIQLSRTAQGSGELAAAAAFELGNGFYNMSYWGNSRVVYSTKNGNFEDAAMTRTMGLAEKYYLRARDLATNKEAKARAVFMAAKAEQNRYYLTRKSDSEPQPHSYFQMLRAQFSDAQYYQEIIRECEYFRRFLQP